MNFWKILYYYYKFSFFHYNYNFIYKKMKVRSLSTGNIFENKYLKKNYPN